MKVTVKRQLSGGGYTVRFLVAGFTPDEVTKMQQFGIPTISMVHTPSPNARSSVSVPITQIAEHITATFPSELEAKRYEDSVTNQIRQAMASLREKKDDFTGTQEVEI